MKKRNAKMSRRAQITIFIIAAIVMVAVVALALYFRGSISIPGFGAGREFNPDSFLDTCINEKVREAVDLISIQGGYLSNPLNKTFKFSDEDNFYDISYLCYTQNYYIPCINQKPMFMKYLPNEIKNYISEDVGNCINDFKTSLEAQNYEVTAAVRGFNVSLHSKKIIINVNSRIAWAKDDESNEKQGFKVIVPSRFYDLAVVAQEIVSQEARFCHFGNLRFMLLYPEFNIEKFRTGDLVTIYTIAHKKTKELFRFAVRSCAIPAGL